MEARRGHLVTVNQDVLCIRRGLDPVASLFPANSSMDRGDPLAFQDDVAGRARAKEHGMIARQVDELNAALSVVDFQSGHTKLFSSDSGGQSFGPSRGETLRRWPLEVSRSTKGLLGEHLESVAICLGYDAEAGYPDLARLSTPVSYLELSKLILHPFRIELQDDPVADVDTCLLE